VNYIVVSLPESEQFAQKLAQRLHVKMYVPQVIQFADKEINFLIDSQVIQSCYVLLVNAQMENVHDSFMRFSLLAHALNAAGAVYIIGVVPYLWYARQSNNNTDSLALILAMLGTLNFNFFISVELHCPDFLKFFKLPMHHIVLHDYIADHINQHIPEKNFFLVAPDQGALERVKKIAHILQKPIVLFKKERIDVNYTIITSMEGTCMGGVAIIVDDIINTGLTAIGACNELKKMGVQKIYGYFVHSLLTEQALQRIQRGNFDKIFISNSVSQCFLKADNIEIFDVTDSIAQIIKHIIKNNSR
jgi:ribose-phosphate pyrophosphokinase